MPFESLEGLAPRARVTDDVGFYCQRGELPNALNVVQRRGPDFHRWRRAFNYVARVSCAWLSGKELLWTESALRDVAGGVGDPVLHKELVLDARENQVRMDLGQPLPNWTARDVMRFADETDVDMGTLRRITQLPGHVGDPVDSAGIVLVSREMSRRHRLRAQSLWLELPDEEDACLWEPKHHSIAKVAEVAAEAGARWKKFSSRVFG